MAHQRSDAASDGGPLILALRTRFAHREFFAFCEGFRMPAADERCRKHGRPASESLQGRKPRMVGGMARQALWGFERCERALVSSPR